MKKEKEFVKITGILESPISGINFAFLIKTEVNDTLENCKIIHDNNYGNKYIELLGEKISKWGRDIYYSVIIDDIEKELGDYCYEDESGLKIIKCKHCGGRENESTAYLGYEFITEKEFNNSDKWETPSKTRIHKIIESSKRNRTCDGWDM